MSRRQLGTIRRLSSGRWQVRYRTGSGSRVTAPGTFATRSEASRWLATIEAGHGREWTDPNAGRVLLSDYCRQWLDGRPSLAPRTREIYRHQLSCHVLPQISDGVPPLGRVRLDRLTPELLRMWYGALRQAKGASVAAKAYVRLRQVLTQAVDDDRIARNPCRFEGESSVFTTSRAAPLERNNFRGRVWLPARMPPGGAQLGHKAAGTGSGLPPEKAKGASDQHFR